MASIFSLFGEILIDNTNANKSIDTTTEKAKKSGSKIGSAFSSIVKGATAVGSAVVAGASTVGTAAYKMATDVADTAGGIDDAAKKVGTSAEEYQKWAYAAKLGGMETTKLEALMVKQQKAFSDAKDGSKAMSEAYERLGVDISKIDSSGEAFNTVIAKLADMEDETTRNALANDIFGKSYADLAPLLAEGSEGIEKWKQECADLGGVMSNEAVEAGAQFGDSIDRLKTSFSGIFNSIGGAVIPIIKEVVDLIVSNMPTIQGVFASLTPIISSVFGQLMPPLFDLEQTLFPILINLISTLLPPIQTIITSLLPVVTDLITMLLPPITQIIQMLLPLLINLITPILPLLQPIFQLLQPFIDLLLIILEPLTQLLNMILPPLITIIEKIISVAIVPLQAALGMLADIIGSVVTTAFDNIMSKVETVKTVFSNIIDFIKNVFFGNWSTAWENVRNIFISIFDGFKERVGNVFEGIIGVIKAPVNAVIKIINKLIEAVNSVSFEIPDWVPEWGGKTFGLDLKPIQLLAKGAVVDEPTPAIIGEDGAEAVVPLEKNTQWISRLADDINSKTSSNSESAALLKEILAEIKALRRELYEIIVSALCDGVSVEWKERELMRLIKTYAT